MVKPDRLIRNHDLRKSEGYCPRHLPATRAECINGPRPCPYVSCRFNLYLDVTAKGSITLNYPDKEVWEVDDSLCALDHASQGRMTLEEVGQRFGMTRERIRQIEELGLRHMKRNLRDMPDAQELLESMFELEHNRISLDNL